jgi:hypothetical protein
VHLGHAQFGPFPNGISCPSLSLCVVTGSDGHTSFVLTSTDPTGGPGAWNTTLGPPNSIFVGVSCPSTALCVALDAHNDTGPPTAVDVSTTPSDSGRTWKRTVLDNNKPQAVACTSVSVCVVASCPLFCGFSTFEAISSFDPAGADPMWQASPAASTVYALALSCPALYRCVAVDAAGNVVVGTAPPSPSPTAQQIQALLTAGLTPRSRLLRVRQLLKRGRYTQSFTAPSAGRLSNAWYTAQPPNGHRSPLLVATGNRNYTKPGTLRITIHLTRQGRHLLAHATHRKGKRIRMTAEGNFTPIDQATVTATTRFVIRR